MKNTLKITLTAAIFSSALLTLAGANAVSQQATAIALGNTLWPKSGSLCSTNTFSEYQVVGTASQAARPASPFTETPCWKQSGQSSYVAESGYGRNSNCVFNDYGFKLTLACSNFKGTRYVNIVNPLATAEGTGPTADISGCGQTIDYNAATDQFTISSGICSIYSQGTAN